MRQSLRIGRVAGVDVGANWSVLAIFALIAWQLASLILPDAVPGVASASYWAAGLLAAAAFLISLLVHEASHAVVARRNRVGVRSITLWLFGGVAELESEPRTPGADFRIAAAGPAASLLLAVLFAGGTALAGGPVDVFASGPAYFSSSTAALISAALTWLAEINVLLAVFNLVPAAPLDGGRILRAALWRLWHDRSRAARAAGNAGRVFGVVLIGLGIAGVLLGRWSGVWAALLGWFLYAAAGAEARDTDMQDRLAPLAVWQVMEPNPPAVWWRSSIAEAVGHLHGYHGSAVAVTDDRGWLAGVLTAEAACAVPVERRSSTDVGTVAVLGPEVVFARADEPVAVLLERMATVHGGPALVIGPENRLAGLVTQEDVARAAALGTRPAEPVPAGR